MKVINGGRPVPDDWQPREELSDVGKRIAIAALCMLTAVGLLGTIPLIDYILRWWGLY